MKFSLLILLVAPVYGLVCYDNERGPLSEVQDDSWDYCVLIPQTDGNEAKMFGISSVEDSVTSYETSFKNSDPIYKVLTVCLLEKYDLGAISPKFGNPEFLFRCICNYDRCNSHRTFSRYITKVREDNTVN